MNLDQLTAQKGMLSTGKLNGIYIDLYLCKVLASDLMKMMINVNFLFINIGQTNESGTTTGHTSFP